MARHWWCEHCGHEWDLDAHEDSIFCPNCGSTLIDYEEDEDWEVSE